MNVRDGQTQELFKGVVYPVHKTVNYWTPKIPHFSTGSSEICHDPTKPATAAWFYRWYCHFLDKLHYLGFVLWNYS